MASEEKSDGQKLTDAYQKQDWKTIVVIGDTLVGDSDKMNLSIPYAEALAAVGNPQKLFAENNYLQETMEYAKRVQRMLINIISE